MRGFQRQESGRFRNAPIHVGFLRKLVNHGRLNAIGTFRSLTPIPGNLGFPGSDCSGTSAPFQIGTLIGTAGRHSAYKTTSRGQQAQAAGLHRNSGKTAQKILMWVD